MVLCGQQRRLRRFLRPPFATLLIILFSFAHFSSFSFFFLSRFRVEIVKTKKNRWTTIVERNIASPGVLIYSKTYCSFCAKLKALLRHLRIPYRVEVRAHQKNISGHRNSERFPGSKKNSPREYAANGCHKSR